MAKEKQKEKKPHNAYSISVLFAFLRCVFTFGIHKKNVSLSRTPRGFESVFVFLFAGARDEWSGPIDSFIIFSFFP